MPTSADLLPLVADPREDLSVECKEWLDLSSSSGKATLAKAAIALANGGGGYIVLGVSEAGGILQSVQLPEGVAEPTQDAVNAAIRRYASPEFHCEAHMIRHPVTDVRHMVVAVPGGMREPVMTSRECEGVFKAYRCFVRKPGPRSEEAKTQEEWRALLDRCILARREDMLDAIRAIVIGRVEPVPAAPDAATLLGAFCDESRERWNALVSDLPADSPPRFPRGHFELGFKFVGGGMMASLTDMNELMGRARRGYTGWPLFLQMNTHGREPHSHDGAIEAWVGRPEPGEWNERDSSLCDFWRVSRSADLFTMRGYKEDALRDYAPGTIMDVTLPVWRVGEGLLFAERLSRLLTGVTTIAVTCRFTGLMNRKLVSVGNLRAFFGDDVCRSEAITLTAQHAPDQVRDNLNEVLHQLLAPFYELFGFFKLPLELVAEELKKMHGERF